MDKTSAQKPPIPTKALVLLFAGVTILAFFTSHATLSVDPPNRYQVAQSIVDYGDLRIRPAPDEPLTPGTRIGLDGNYYSSFGIGQALIFAGPYYILHHLLGIQSDKLIRSVIAITVFPVTLGLTALFFFALLREFGFSAQRCFWAAVLLAFATGLWQLSKEGQEGNHLALLFALSAFTLRRYQNTNSLKALAVSALAMAFAFLTRSDTTPTVLCYLFLAFYFIYQNYHHISHSTAKTKCVLFPYILVLALMIPAFIIQSYINYRAFGDITPPHNPFSLSFLPQGLMGLLFSPGRSLFLYNPILLLALPGLLILWRQHRPWALFVIAAFTGCLLLHAAADCFHGNCCWGPRYLCRQFPLLFIPLAFFIFHPPRIPLLRRITFIFIASLSIMIQIAAVSMHHCRELGQLAQAYNVGWSDRQWTMFEPEAHFLTIRLANLAAGIDEMAHDKIAPWPTEKNDSLPTDQELNAPVLHYLAFWPYHLTYYLPAIKPSLAFPLWLSTTILIVGLLLGLSFLYRSCQHCKKMNVGWVLNPA